MATLVVTVLTDMCAPENMNLLAYVVLCMNIVVLIVQVALFEGFYQLFRAILCVYCEGKHHWSIDDQQY